MTKKQEIPKVIHYCWFGNNPKNKLIQKCIQSWKKYCPDYKIIEWNENNFKISKSVPYVKEAYNNQKWAFVADYVRLWAVYNYGGIYLDTDVELIRSLDPLLKYRSFFSTENNKNVNTGLGFGAKAGDKLVLDILESYQNIHFEYNGKLDLTPCTKRNTITISKFINNDINSVIDKEHNNRIILSSEYFSPFNSKTGVMRKSQNTFGIHWYNASWRSNKINMREKVLRPFKRIIGVERFDRIFKRNRE